MHNYSFFEWILIFYIYCFLGWATESSLVSWRKRKLVNRGFLKSPLIPIYGIGAVVILWICLPIKHNPILVFIVGMVVATILEYITGWLMESVFKIKYWNYSDYKFNLRGRICLQSSLIWGLLSIILTIYIYGLVQKFVVSLNAININLITIITSFVFMSDFVYSICNVIHFNITLAFITKIKKEMDLLNIELINAKTNSSHKAEYILNKKVKELAKDYERHILKVKLFHKQLRRSYPKASSKHLNEILK